ncbi:amino acid permease-domain-containing protein [Aspergillus keveii]|uniref:Amino acid permease-domain-containing protein n=1 Tax=Aspergillus keveii TaxID=714993 RepID=A0ABR4FZI5_9EURO
MESHALPNLPSRSSQDNTRGSNELNPPQITSIIVRPSPNRLVKRDLKGVHIIMITVNGTLGIGLYWRGGQILELAGPLAAVLAFFLVGLLCWAVMQCITEMICIWPIPGALSVFVSEFVDAELGIAVGIAYWFSYAVAFGALIATLAAEVDFWTGSGGNKAIDGGVIYLAIPLLLVAINAINVQAYGWIEVVCGTIKIMFLVAIAGILIAINVGAGKQGYIGAKNWSSAKVFDSDAADNWCTAFLMCISLATFAYIGIEIVAASALESAPDPKRGSRENPPGQAMESQASPGSNDWLVANTIMFSTKYICVLATLAYSLSGLLVSFDIPWNHCHLPRLSWINRTAHSDCDASVVMAANTTSAIVAIAIESGVPHLGDIVNVFIVFTCISCAGTMLYVASRVLFGLTSRLDGGASQPWHLRLLAWLGRTSRHGVPVRAMVFSAAAFIWVPFLQLSGGTDTTRPIGLFIETMAQMSSVAVVIVWTSQVLAFIRYYHCIKRHRDVLQKQETPRLSRFNREDPTDYPYRSHAQPVLAYLALAGCLFILLVTNGAFLWKGFHKFPFLSGYLFLIAFAALWIFLKVVRGAKWSFVDLSNPTKVVRKLRKLHDIRLAAA